MHRGIGLGVALWAAVAAAAGCQEATDKLASSDPDVCIEGLREVAQSDNDEAVVHRVAEIVNQADERVSVEAVRSLGQMRAPQAAETVRRVATTDTRPIVRQEAVLALGRENSPDALAVLRQAIKVDADPLVRASAATSLGRLGSLADVPLLVEVAQTDGELIVECRAVHAVQELVGLRFGYDPRAPREERRQAVERMRARALTAARTLQREEMRKQVLRRKGA